jgi:hypothetical protein
VGESALGLLVVWAGDQAGRERAVRHARTLFELRRLHAVRWTPALAAENCARLNRPELRSPSSAGTPAPLLVLTVDATPSFADASRQFRAGIGTAASVHASSGTAATRDLMLLLGVDPPTHLAGHEAWDGRIEEVSRDLAGARGWTSARELFHVLNHTVRYLVLRNFEEMPESLHVDAHADVDVLTDDYPELARVLNARRHVRCIPRWGGPHWVRIAGTEVWFDLRFVGDGYYDPTWARALLDRRVRHANGFFTPSDEDYFESLAYHAVVHKRMFAPDYGQRLAAMARAAGRPEADAAALHDPARVKTEVDAILARRGYRYCRPRDVNVFYNFEAVGHRWPRARRKLAGLARRAVRAAHRLRRAAGAGPRALEAQ